MICEARSTVVFSRLQDRAEVAFSQIVTYPVFMSREMYEGKQLEQLDAHWEEGHIKPEVSVLLLFCRQIQGKRQVFHNNLENTSVPCLRLWDVPSQKSPSPNAALLLAQCAIKLKHCLRLWRLR